MECFNCSNKPCICQDLIDAFNNGKHCARLITPVPNPHKLGTELHVQWTLGFMKGKEEVKAEFREWKEEQEEKNRLYASEIRTMGIPLPDTIPNCGYVSRDAMIIKMDENNKTCLTENGAMSIPLIVQFTEPFKWVEANITATKINPS